MNYMVRYELQWLGRNYMVRYELLGRLRYELHGKI